jgi:hypothetical protein
MATHVANFRANRIATFFANLLVIDYTAIGFTNFAASHIAKRLTRIVAKAVGIRPVKVRSVSRHSKQRNKQHN